MRNLRFYKEDTNNWYADIPKWLGFKAQLQMVAGADTLLDYVSNGKNEVTLGLSETEIENSECLELVNIFKGYNFFGFNLKIFGGTDNGAIYMLKKFNGKIIDYEIWLCNVTKFVFGKFPKKIYFIVI
jgi:hypothetical protein